jgi:hypothetical protein
MLASMISGSRPAWVLSLPVLFATALTACGAFGTTKIGDILKDVRAYDGKTVTIAGEVTESANLMIVKYYEVEDGSGKIVVVTERAVPEKGERVRVTGQVNQAFALGDKSVAVILEPSGK